VGRAVFEIRDCVDALTRLKIELFNMPFPIEEKYISQTESELDVVFPPMFKKKMMKSNGGELIAEDFGFEQYPFFDKSEKKRINRTCNHIGLETKKAQEWNSFPQNAIAIASDAYGNQVILMHKGDGKLTEEIYFWDHETGEIEKIANSINDFD